jgi:hypothetical protein
VKLYSLVALFALEMLSSCSRSQKAQIAPQPTLLVSNILNPGGKSDWIVYNTNGISVYLHDREVVVNYGLDSSMTISFDPKTRAITNVILERPPQDSEPGEYIIDANGDGIPEQRRVKAADSNDLLYEGKWYRYKTSGKVALIIVAGREVKVAYDGTNWSVTNQAEK